MLKSWTVTKVEETTEALKIEGTSKTRKTDPQPFNLTLEKNLAEAGAMQVFRGTVTWVGGLTTAKAKAIADHLTATGQLKAGVQIVA